MRPTERTVHDHAGDLHRAPLTYPGEAVPGPRLVVGDCAHTIRPRRSRGAGSVRSGGCVRCDLPVGGGADSLDRSLRHLGATPLSGRTPLLAVGSNAAASVVRHKLTRAGVSPVVPLLTGVVRNLAIGHTAYVSRGGYVPAAPVHRSRARTPVVLQLVDDEQLAAIDATEGGGYERVELRASRYPLVLTGQIRPTRFHVYAARDGVLGLPHTGRRFLPQDEVLGALHDQGLPHTTGEPADVAAGFAGSAEHRAEVKAALGERGMAWGSGLVAYPAGELRWPDVVRQPRPRHRRVARGRR
ncbi:hypothetical protein [Phycicoccus flavus]|uniref:hypothetical protein n=1 Tax=Phycicoccus flavus TaxID=2502783 RepID=UPI000FEBD34B|nr:hypothetical protein [Phycicoccus flavus]NHA68189.1 hypothetical protein [Phycicoccus flavus]